MTRVILALALVAVTLALPAKNVMTPTADLAQDDAHEPAAAELDNAGKPGSDMLRAYLDKQTAGSEALRDWTAGLPQ